MNANRRLGVKEALSENISALMSHHDIPSQNQLAKLAKIDQTTISRILAKKHAAQIDKVEAIAGVFGLRAWQLLIPHLDPCNPPVQCMSLAERELYERLNAAMALIQQKQKP